MPEPKNPAVDSLVFVTKFGDGWVKESGTTANPISTEMGKLLKSLGISGSRNFYALRHTFETIGGEAKDQVAVEHIMGHVRDDMASVYRERISDDRLKAVVNHVHDWVFGTAPEDDTTAPATTATDTPLSNTFLQSKDDTRP